MKKDIKQAIEETDVAFCLRGILVASFFGTMAVIWIAIWLVVSG